MANIQETIAAFRKARELLRKLTGLDGEEFDDPKHEAEKAYYAARKALTAELLPLLDEEASDAFNASIREFNGRSQILHKAAVQAYAQLDSKVARVVAGRHPEGEQITNPYAQIVAEKAALNEFYDAVLESVIETLPASECVCAAEVTD